jgi:hypothetical protein
MWKEFVEAFGWRFNGVEGYQSAQMWVEEMKTWVLYQQKEAQQNVQRTALAAGLIGCVLGSGFSLAIYTLLFGCR